MKNERALQYQHPQPTIPIPHPSPMSRISIDVTPQQHQRLNALTALRGRSIKEFVLERTLAPTSETTEEDKALKELETLLDERLRGAKATPSSLSSMNAGTSSTD